jgi:hypothetical protein
MEEIGGRHDRRSRLYAAIGRLFLWHQHPTVSPRLLFAEGKNDETR